MATMRRTLAAMLLAATAGEAPDKLVLNEKAYCRATVQFECDRISPAALKAEGEKVLGQRGVEQLKNMVRWRYGDANRAAYLPARLTGGRKAFDEGHWMEEVYYSFQWLQYGGSRERADLFIHDPPPPEGWMGADFDDAGWLYQRKPFMVGRELTKGWYRRAGYFRFRFDAPKVPAGGLKLRLSYAGGARVFVNGQEIARGYLPEGQITEAARGADYPLGAYVQLDEKGQAVVRADSKGRGDDWAHVGELPARFELGEPALDNKRQPVPDTILVARRNVTRVVFDQVAAARKREIVADVPAKLLRAGGNVLAVQVVASDVHPVSIAGRSNWTTPYYGDVSWSHGQVLDLELTDPSGTVPPAMSRPPGVQAWAEDLHRTVISGEFRQAGVPPRVLRLVGAANGRFGGQVVVRADRELTGVKAVVSELKSGEGGTLPGAAVAVREMVGHPLSEWHTLGWGRGGMPYCKDIFCPSSSVALARHGPEGIASADYQTRAAELGKLMFFDHVSDARIDEHAAAISSVPADSARPFYVELTVPPDVAPGTYKGEITLSGEGLKPIPLPVEAEIAAWRVPDPRHFQVNAALEQSPYGVAIQYGCPLWSDEHFRLMEGSFRQLAAIGNDWLNIPIINYTEFGNVTDSMVPWRRTKDGQYAFDYTRMDRYLDLALSGDTIQAGRREGDRQRGTAPGSPAGTRSSVGGPQNPPRVINFIIMHGTTGDEADIQVFDEAAGKEVNLKLDNRAPEHAAAWQAFALSLWDHMRSRGLEDSVYYGFLWDSVADQELPPMLAQITPAVRWTSGAHRGREHFYVTAFSQLLPFHMTEQSMMGWKNPLFHVLLPRGGGSLIAGPGVADPFNFRLMVDRSLVVGMNGVGRMGADYWKDSYIKGLRQEGFLRAGMPNHFMLWPGKDGAEASLRFLALREGIQEGEARIWLEQLLDRKALPEELAGRVKGVLDEHHRQTLFVPSMDSSPQHSEMALTWKDRSRALFAAAAEAAKLVPTDLDSYAIDAEVPARGKVTRHVKLRGYDTVVHDWTIAADRPWIAVSLVGGHDTGEQAGMSSSGRTGAGSPAGPRSSVSCPPTSGHTDVAVTLDAAKLPPGQATGKLSITADGRAMEVAIDAKVGPVFETVLSTSGLDRKEFRFLADDGFEVISVAPGSSRTQTVSFANRSGAEVAWKAACPLAGVKIDPAEGKAGAGNMVFLKVTAAPPAPSKPALPGGAVGGEARHETKIIITEPGGSATAEIPLIVYALPPHAAPAGELKGTAVALTPDLHKELLASRIEVKPQWCGHEVLYVGNTPGAAPMPKDAATERGHPVARVLTAPAPYKITYKIEGRGFTAFTAAVDLPKDGQGYKYWDPGGPIPEWVKMRFEVYVDGALAAASDWLGQKDDWQKLVVEKIPASAKTLSLVTRFEKLPPAGVTGAWWDATFYN